MAARRIARCHRRMATPSRQLNPNANACQQQYGNGITGTSRPPSAAGTQQTDRVTGDIPGQRASSTDQLRPVGVRRSQQRGLAFLVLHRRGRRPTRLVRRRSERAAGAQTIYSTDFEDSERAPHLQRRLPRRHPDRSVVHQRHGHYVDASSGNPADHAYYIELRDRSGFDFDGRGQNDRAAIGFEPGLLVVYTDESHGIGNYSARRTRRPRAARLDAAPAAAPGRAGSGTGQLRGEPAR